MSNEFDPDKYLAEDVGDFDPDTYLSEEEISEEELAALEKSVQEEGIDVPAPVYGAAAGLALQKGAEKAIDMTESAAEKMAFRALGGGGTKAGKNLIQSMVESGALEDDQMLKGRITPRSVGRRALDEGLMSGDLQKTQEALLKGSKETEDLLSKVEGQKSLDELLGEYKSLAEADQLDPTVPLDKQKMSMLEKQATDFEGTRSAKELERAKKGLQGSVDYGTEGATARKQLNKAQAKAYKEATEGLVKQQGGKDLLEEFRKLKKASGERGIVKDILKEDLATQALRDAGGKTFTDKISKRGILTSLAEGSAKKATGIGAKTLDIASKIGKSKPVKGMLKSFPILGAYLTYDDAKAAGASEAEAIALTAVDEATDVVLGLPKLAAQIGMGSLEQDELAKVLEDPKSTPQERMTAEYQFQMDKLKNPETSKENKEFAAQRLESLMKNYKTMKETQSVDKPLIEGQKIPQPNEVEGVINEINNSNTEQYKVFLPALSRAQQGTEKERIQAQFELMQQPAFRKMLKDFGMR